MCVRDFWSAQQVFWQRFVSVSRFALGAGPLGQGLENLRTEELGLRSRSCCCCSKLLLFVASPAINGFSRMQEHGGGRLRIGSEFTGWVPNSEEVAAHAFQVLGELDLGGSGIRRPFISNFWLYSHPPWRSGLCSRMAMNPWSKGRIAKVT